MTLQKLIWTSHGLLRNLLQTPNLPDLPGRIEGRLEELDLALAMRPFEKQAVGEARARPSNTWASWSSAARLPAPSVRPAAHPEVLGSTPVPAAAAHHRE